MAVLPFVNMSGDPETEYFSDGMSEELLNLLAQVPGLRVAARTSSFSFKGRNVPVDSIGRVLRVRHLLEGSVRQSGDRLRITAQLVDAETGYHLWSGTFDRRVEDVFAVQDSIGRVIVATLAPRLATGAPAAEADTGSRQQPADAEAYVSVLKGWRVFRQNTREAYEAAALHFQDAIRRDPRYGRGYAGLATIRHWQANFRHLPPDSAYPEAERLARQALALDPELADAHLVLGRIAEVWKRDFAAAEAHFAQAIEVNPSDPRGYSRRAQLLVALGRPEEAIASAQRAVQLDPASPAEHAALASTYSRLDRYAEAEQAQRAALALDPGHPLLVGNLALHLTYQQKFAEAAAVIAEARQRHPRNESLLGQHAFIEAKLGHEDVARALLDTLATTPESPVNQANIAAMIGDRARAFTLLERALRERDDRLVSVLDPGILQPLRGDPRMDRIVARVRGMQDAERR